MCEIDILNFGTGTMIVEYAIICAKMAQMDELTKSVNVAIITETGGEADGTYKK